MMVVLRKTTSAIVYVAYGLTSLTEHHFYLKETVRQTGYSYLGMWHIFSQKLMKHAACHFQGEISNNISCQ